MKRKIMLFGIFTSVLLGSVNGISYASEEIDIYPNANEINITLNNEKWIGKDVSVLIYSKTDRENNEITEKEITEDNFSDIVVYADVLTVGDDGKYAFSYLMNDNDISGDYEVNVSLTDGTENCEEIYYYASKSDRDRLSKEIKTALENKDIEELGEIFLREGKDYSVLKSSGYLCDEYLKLSDKDNILNNFIDIYKDDTVKAFNEAVITQNVNEAEVGELKAVFEKYKSNIGMDITENKNYIALAEDEKENVLFKAVDKKDFSSFEDIKEEFEKLAALSVLNAEESYTEIYGILENNNDIFKLSFTTYDRLSDYYKSVVAKAMVSEDFETVEALQEAFDNETADALKAMNKGANSNKGGSSGGSSGGGIALGDTVNAIIEKNNPKEDSEEIQETIFDDLEDCEWAKEAIEELYKKNIVSGVGNKKFEPMRNITREEFVKLVVLAFGFELSEGETGFSDVSSGAWYENYIKTAIDNGIVKGISEEEFGVGKNITRQDMAVIVARVKNMGSVENAELFADDSDISDYAKEAVYAVKGAGIISGMGENRFAPKNNATRAQAAKIIYMGIK